MSDDTKGLEVETDEKTDAETNPLLPDLHRWKEKAREAEKKLAEIKLAKAEAEREDEIKSAKTKEELEALQEKLASDYAAKERGLKLEAEAAKAGVHPAFLSFADDGILPAESVIERAAEAQKAHEEKLSDAQKVNQMGGGTSPAPTGKKVWKESEIANLSLDEYTKHRDDIAAATQDGRFLKGE